MRARENPFAVHRVEAIRYRPQGWTWDQRLARLAQLNYRAAIIGPHGSGKTTLLEDLRPRLGALGFRTILLRLTAADRSLPAGFCTSTAGRSHIVLLDGAERLSRPGWWRFVHRTRGAAGVVITSHRLGLLPTWIECATTPRLLGEIVSELTAGSSSVDERTTSDLFIRHAGNLRAALRELYDRHAEQPYSAGATDGSLPRGREPGRVAPVRAWNSQS